MLLNRPINGLLAPHDLMFQESEKSNFQKLVRYSVSMVGRTEMDLMGYLCKLAN